MSISPWTILELILEKEEKECCFYLILGWYVYNFVFKTNGLHENSVKFT